MRLHYGLILIFLSCHLAHSAERTGLLLVGALYKFDGSTHDVEWASTSVIVSINDESMVIKPSDGFIDLQMGKIGSITMKGNSDIKFEGGGASDIHLAQQIEGIRGINLILSKDKNGYYRGIGNVFYPQDSHDVQVILFLNPLK